MKQCSNCKQYLDETNFYPDKNKRDGLYSKCKKCTVEYSINWQSNHKEEMRLRVKKRTHEIKVITLTHYGNGMLACVKCGEQRLACLSIDHINGGGERHNKSLGRYGGSFYRYLKINNFPEGYQTLCMNCQWVKKYEKNENRGQQACIDAMGGK